MDSDINANYNRAKKKNWADVNTGIVWINTAYIFLVAVLFRLGISDIYALGSMVIYLVLLMTEMAFFVRSSRKIDEHYRKDIELETDDDEHWIGGIIYYNPGDRRAMIEKRAGIGTTVNFAHPVGKITAVFLALSILVTLASLVWVGFVTTTPINLRIEDNRLICHQLRDEYIIPLNIIKAAEIGDIKELRLVRTSGVGTDTLLKGNFSVNGEGGCTVFLAPKERVYIHILTNSGMNYYISGGTAQETEDIYGQLK